MIRKLGLSFLTSVAILAIVSVPGQKASAELQRPLTHHVRVQTQNGEAKLLGHMAAATPLKLDIVLNLSDPEGLKALVAEMYDPSSPNYKHYITPAQFTERFGPSQSDWDTVVAWAKGQGFEVTGGSRDAFDLHITGTAAIVEKAFHVTMNHYQDPDDGTKTLFAADREPTLDLPFPVWHVTGLNNFAKPHTRLVKREDYAAAHGISPEAVVSHATTGSGPSASFLGSDMRAAYYGGTALTGAGQHLGLFEYLGTDLADLTTYYTNVHQTEPITPLIYSPDGSSTSCVYSGSQKCDDGEQNLDMTQIMGMAPGLASLVMYVSTTSDSAIISAMTVTNATTPYLPSTIGCSWGWTPEDPTTLDPYWEKMSVQGQTFFAASGDSSTWSKNNEAWPADDPYVISVGGTDLTTASAGGAWKTETAWVDSGGGISPGKITIPTWQQLTGVITSTNEGSTAYRNGPDVSANANFTFYTCGDQKACQANVYGGTSFAAPMWAGYVALLNQQLASEGQPNIGFFDPAIYPLGLGSGYGSAFHDIKSGTSGSFSATTGYDLVTGWGSPNGSGLVSALDAATLTATPTTGTTATSFGAAVAYPGFDGTATVYYALGAATPTSLGTCAETSSVLNSCTYTFAGSNIGPGPYNLTGQLVWVEVGSGTTSSYTSKTTASTPITIIDTTATTGVATPSSIPSTSSTSIKVTVADNVTSTFTPTAETITLKLGSTTLTTCTLAAGTCTATVNGSQLAIGNNTITLSYPGATNYYNASSGTVIVMVSAPAAASTATTVSASPGSITTAQTTVFTAQVSDTTNPANAPTGTVTFTLNSTGGTQVGSCSLSATIARKSNATSNYATCSSAAVSGATLGAGTQTVYANYGGATGLFAASTGSTTVNVTGLSATLGAVSFSPASSEVAGTSVAITISDTLTFNGSAPSGAVTFVLNGATYTATCGTTSPATCSATVPATTIAALAINAYTVTGALAAGGGYAAATATSGTFTVTAPATASITFTSVSHNFGQVAVGTAAIPYGLTITNSGTAAYPFSLVFTPANGFTSANNCGTSIAAGAKCQMDFYFTPTATAPVSATWSLVAENGFTYAPSNGGTLTGSGTTSGGVSLTTAGHNFGTVAVGSTSPTYGVVLSNSTTAAVTLSLGSVTSPYASATNCGPSLAAGASCNIQFTFTPTSTSTVQQVYTLSASTPITSGGAALPNGGITLTGN